MSSASSSCSIPILLLLLCGVPGTGKSSLSRSLSSAAESLAFTLHCFSFDRIFNSLLPSSSLSLSDPLPFLLASRSARSQMIDSVTSLITALNDSSSLSADARHIILIDRTNHLHSMRKPFIRLAQRFHVPIVCVIVSAPLEASLQRIQDRKQSNEAADLLLTRASVEKIAATFEFPSASECRSFIYSNAAASPAQRDYEPTIPDELIQFINSSFSPAFIPAHVESSSLSDSARASARQVTLHDFPHQMDCEMRQLIGKAIQAVRTADHNYANGKDSTTISLFAQRINQVRVNILSVLKRIRGKNEPTKTSKQKEKEKSASENVGDDPMAPLVSLLESAPVEEFQVSGSIADELLSAFQRTIEHECSAALGDRS